MPSRLPHGDKMFSATPKSAIDILGLEYDWLGCDPADNVALFSTGGVGCAPAEFLRDTDAHDDAIQALLALPSTTEARFAPDIPADLVNTWKLVAERGLYAYDCDPSGGPYRLVAEPILPAKAGDLPPEIREVALRIRCPVSFGDITAMGELILSPHL